MKSLLYSHLYIHVIYIAKMFVVFSIAWTSWSEYLVYLYEACAYNPCQRKCPREQNYKVYIIKFLRNKGK